MMQNEVSSAKVSSSKLLCGCSRAFPNDEIDQAATAMRQVARMLWGVHVTLQMGFEEEVKTS